MAIVSDTVFPRLLSFTLKIEFLVILELLWFLGFLEPSEPSETLETLKSSESFEFSEIRELSRKRYLEEERHRRSRNNEAFVSHAVLHGGTCEMAHDQRATLSDRIRQHQVILLASISGRS